MCGIGLWVAALEEEWVELPDRGGYGTWVDGACAKETNWEAVVGILFGVGEERSSDEGARSVATNDHAAFDGAGAGWSVKSHVDGAIVCVLE